MSIELMIPETMADDAVIARWDHPSGYRAVVRQMGIVNIGRRPPVPCPVFHIRVTNPEGDYVPPTIEVGARDGEACPGLRAVFENRVRRLLEAARA